MSSVLVGMFDKLQSAKDARMKLLDAGFAESAVSLHPDGPMGMSPTAEPISADVPEKEGAISRFFHSLFDGEDDASDVSRKSYTDTYGEAIRRGAYGVVVRTISDEETDKASDILDEAGALDIDAQSEQWRTEGWTGAAPVATFAAQVSPGATQTFKEVEEELKVGKRAVARGGVRVFSRMIEVPVQESVRLREEHADIQRRAVDRPATEADFAAFKDGSIEVREMAEEAVVSKTARVVGEVEVGRVVTEREETVRDTVRKTKVEIEEIDAPSTPVPAASPKF